MNTPAFALFSYRTTNIGDDTQSYATALHLPNVSALVDRDALSSLVLPSPHRCVMNSWFFMGGDTGPPSASIDPIFHGLSVGRSEMLKGAWREYLSSFGPIGCRDTRSVSLLNDAGIDAYWSGCLTLTIGQHFTPVPAEERRGVYIIDVHPDVERQRVPPAISERATRWSNEFDALLLNRPSHRFAEVHRLMRLLAHAELVITRRLHVALPCVGFGTPVLTLPNPGISDARHRFSGYESFVPIVWPEDADASFDFMKPEAATMPERLVSSYRSLDDRLDHRPVQRTWNVDPVSYPVPPDADPGGAFGLRLGMDFENHPTEIREGDRYIRLPIFPFAERLRGNVELAASRPASVPDMLDDYSNRRTVDLIGAQIASQIDVERLDVLMRSLAQADLFDPVMRLWTPTLRAAGKYALEAHWRRSAVRFGTDSYEVGRAIETLLRVESTEEIKESLADMRAALAEQVFRVNGDEFHLLKNQEILDGFEAVFDCEAGVLPLDDARLQSMHPFVTAAVHDLTWYASGRGETGRAIVFSRIYAQAARVAGHDAEQVLGVAEKVLLPGYAANEALEILRALDTRSAPIGQNWRKWTLVAEAGKSVGASADSERAVEELNSLFGKVSVEAVLASPAFTDAFVVAISHCRNGDLGLVERELNRLAPFMHDRRASVLAERLKELKL